MRFEADFSGPRTVLRALFESGDRHRGRRQEGTGTPITYSGEVIEFDYVPDEIHPDLLGLLLLIIYYPFVGERAVFPAPVSPRLEEAFQSSVFDRRIRFDNVDASLEPYIGSRMALAFGGGTDSSAVLSMFPEAFVVHEAHVRAGRVVPSFTHRVVREMGSDRARVVPSNQRYVSRPRRVAQLAVRVCDDPAHGHRPRLRDNPDGLRAGGDAAQDRHRVLRPVRGETLARIHGQLLAVGLQCGGPAGVLAGVRGERFRHLAALASDDQVWARLLVRARSWRSVHAVLEVSPQGLGPCRGRSGPHGEMGGLRPSRHS